MRRQRWACCRILYKIDEVDRHYSAKFHETSKLSIELVLIIFAHFFNRLWIVFSFILATFVGYFRYDVMLESLGYQPVNKEDLDFVARLRLGFTFTLYYALCLGVMVTSTQILKYTIRRPRPERLPHTSRLNNLRKAEDGTFSMPSGDSSAAACFCFLYSYVLQVPAIYLMLPLVMAGRVYYQCHWIADTMVGACIGTFWGFMGYWQFSLIAPFLQLVAGPGTYIPME